jgi:hypothetical protein
VLRKKACAYEHFMLHLCDEEDPGLVSFQPRAQPDDIINPVTKRFIKLDDAFIGRTSL